MGATDLNHYDIAFVRYNANGTLDASYRTGGKVIADLDNRENYMGSMALQTYGKLVFDGSTDLTTDFSYPGNKNIVKLVVGRYNTEGTIDASFGDRGGSIYLNINNALGNTITIESDGKIIAGGVVNYFNRYNVGADFALASLYTNGSGGSSFGINGTTRTGFPLAENNFDLDELRAITISNNRV